MPQALETKKKNPVFPVASSVYVGRGKDLDSLAGFNVKTFKKNAAIIAPHKVWFAALSLLVANIANGTSVVAIATDEKIFIASDGVATISGGGIDRFEPSCKIRNEGPVFYATSGYDYIPTLNFDLRSLGRDAIRRSKTVAAIPHLIEPRVLAFIPSIVEGIKADDPKEYARFTSGLAVSSILFAGFESGVPVISIAEFYIDNH
jgi:hypothetical protein